MTISRLPGTNPANFLEARFWIVFQIADKPGAIGWTIQLGGPTPGPIGSRREPSFVDG
jgi:hypothetical protein